MLSCPGVCVGRGGTVDVRSSGATCELLRGDEFADGLGDVAVVAIAVVGVASSNDGKGTAPRGERGETALSCDSGSAELLLLLVWVINLFASLAASMEFPGVFAFND